jgi:hypothetical protein
MNFRLQVMLNILADEIHRAHQRCLQDSCCDPNQKIIDLVFEAAANSMKLLKGAYSCLALIKGVGLVAFRDPYGIRYPLPPPPSCRSKQDHLTQCGRAHDCQAKGRRFKSRHRRFFQPATLLTCSCGLCGYLGRNPGEGVKLGSNPRFIIVPSFEGR